MNVSQIDPQELIAKIKAVLKPEQLARIERAAASGRLPAILSDDQLQDRIEQRYEQALSKIKGDKFSGPIDPNQDIATQAGEWAKEEAMKQYQQIARDVHGPNNEAILANVFSNPSLIPQHAEFLEAYLKISELKAR